MSTIRLCLKLFMAPSAGNAKTLSIDQTVLPPRPKRSQWASERRAPEESCILSVIWVLWARTAGSV